MTPPGREEAQRRAAEELARPEYADEPLPDRLWRMLQQFLGDLTDFKTGDNPVGAVLAAVLLVLVVVVAVAAMVWLSRRSARTRTAAPGDLFGGRAMTAAEHRLAAERLAGEGRWAEAVQERLRAIARDLQDRALVDSLPGRTADELAAEAGRSLPAFAGELAAAARAFDDVAYGGVPGTPEAYAMLRELDERLRAARPVAP
ncbi:DUF4129 domain-containing protein [Nonomuraea sp. NPDC003804]|uniref:DUF4129 domain-containing protein n=1 Tax=Nonomuraea sp. NPDC003804 TaxID=3154547 RepID=UPI0033AE9AA9